MAPQQGCDDHEAESGDDQTLIQNGAHNGSGDVIGSLVFQQQARPYENGQAQRGLPEQDTGGIDILGESLCIDLASTQEQAADEYQDVTGQVFYLADDKALGKDRGHTDEGEDHPENLQTGEAIPWNEDVGEKSGEERIDRDEYRRPPGQGEMSTCIECVDLYDKERNQEEEGAPFSGLKPDGNPGCDRPGQYGQPAKEESGGRQREWGHAGKTDFDGYGVAAPQNCGEKRQARRFERKTFIEYIQVFGPESEGNRLRANISPAARGKKSHTGCT